MFMKKKRLTIFDAGIAFLLAFILAQFTSAIGISLTQCILQACGKNSEQITAFFDTSLGYLLQAIFMNIAFILVFIWYARRIDKHELINKPNSNTFNYVWKCIIIGIATLFLLSGVLNYFQLLVDKLGFTASELTYELNSPKNYIISLISLALIPAICEELLFRGVLVNALKHKGQIFSIILSSIMFSIFHFSPTQLIYPICFGLILSIIYLRTGNIIFSILLHFINNALTISIQYFSNSSGGQFVHSASMLIYTIVTLSIWIAIMVYLFKDLKSHNKLKISTLANTDNFDSSINNTKSQTTQNNDVSTIKDSETPENTKLNNLVFYGSISIMLCIYILLLML